MRRKIVSEPKRPAMPDRDAAVRARIGSGKGCGRAAAGLGVEEANGSAVAFLDGLEKTVEVVAKLREYPKGNKAAKVVTAFRHKPHDRGLRRCSPEPPPRAGLYPQRAGVHLSEPHLERLDERETSSVEGKRFSGIAGHEDPPGLSVTDTRPGARRLAGGAAAGLGVPKAGAALVPPPPSPSYPPSCPHLGRVCDRAPAPARRPRRR